MILDYTDYRFAYRVLMVGPVDAAGRAAGRAAGDAGRQFSRAVVDWSLSAPSPGSIIVSRYADGDTTYSYDAGWWFSRAVSPWRLGASRTVPLGGLAVRASDVAGELRSYGVASGHRRYGIHIINVGYVVF